LDETDVFVQIYTFVPHLDKISFFIIPEEKATETISDDSLGRFSTAKPQIQKN
jgi:hypothetical protein